MEKPAPVVLIHQGAAPCLSTVLDCLKRSNPEKTTVLMGDDKNIKYAAMAGKFIRYTDFAVGPRLKEFNQTFQPIQGRLHRSTKEGGAENWPAFVFQRWFIMFDFARFASVQRFWTFDTDTLVLAPLSRREDRFSPYEATTQCRDCGLNGFIRSRALLDRYTSCIVELFKDADYLAKQRERQEMQEGIAFNEMDAFCEFRRRQNVRTFHAAQPLNGEFFDDALAYDADFEASPHRVHGHISMKRLWADRCGAIYARHLASGEFVRMITCNLSRLPDYVGRKLARFCLTPEQDARVMPPDSRELKEVDLSQPLTDKISEGLKRKFHRLKRALGR